LPDDLWRAYSSLVRAMVWPREPATSHSGTPDCASQVPQVWRRVCVETWSSPALRAAGRPQVAKREDQRQFWGAVAPSARRARAAPPDMVSWSCSFPYVLSSKISELPGNSERFTLVFGVTGPTAVGPTL